MGRDIFVVTVHLGFGLFAELFWYAGDRYISICLLPDYINDPVCLMMFEV